MKEIKLQEHTYILKNVTASRKSACEVSTVKDILMILKCTPINQIEVSIMLHNIPWTCLNWSSYNSQHKKRGKFNCNEEKKKSTLYSMNGYGNTFVRIKEYMIKRCTSKKNCIFVTCTSGRMIQQLEGFNNQIITYYSCS